MQSRVWLEKKDIKPQTNKSAIRALIPLVVAGVTLFVEIACTLGFIREDLVFFGPSIAGTKGSAAYFRVLTI